MKLFEQIEWICRERNIDRDVLIDTIQAAMKAAAKKVFGDRREIEAVFNEETGEIDLRFIMVVTDEEIESPEKEITLEQARKYADPYAEPGDELLFPIFYREEDIEQAREQDRRFGELLQLETSKHAFGRIAAQTAKQVINQRLKDAERQQIYDEFKDRKNELITGIFRRYVRGNMIIDLGRTEGILYQQHLPRRESYRQNDRILAYVLDVQRSPREAQVILSRTDPGLVIKLFEHEVPEIQEGIVKIVAVARDPGVRTKIAVYSSDPDVDPVGACVGMRGARVQSIVQELRGEKIDIVPYNTDPAHFVCNAINPAQVSKVFIDETRQAMELIVPDDQLSLAIGRAGQNVRLATQLTNWNLEIISESRLEEIKAEIKASLMNYQGVTNELVDSLFQHGYNRLEDIATADVTDIMMIPGYTEDDAENIVAAAHDILERGAEDDEPVTALDLEREALMEIEGISDRIAGQLYDAGYTEPIFLVAENNSEQLALLADIDLRKAVQILAAAIEWYDEQGFSDEEKAEHEAEFELIRQEFAAIAAEIEAEIALEEDEDDEDEEEGEEQVFVESEEDEESDEDAEGTFEEEDSFDDEGEEE